MRICSPQLGVAPDARLGGEVFDREILTHLAELGVEVEILLPGGLPCPEVAGWRVTRLPLRRGYRWLVSNLLFVPYIGRLYRRRPFDILRVHSLRFTGLAALWARRLYRLPVPIVAHHHHIDRDRWTELVDRRAAAGADCVITGSAFSRALLTAELGMPRNKTRVVYYGVDDRFRPAASRAVREAPLVLHVGSLKPRKNLALLLQAFQTVCATVPGARLVLVGRGPEEPSLRAQAGRLGLAGNVTFAGAVGEEEKLALYRSASVYVSPSQLEGFGLSVAEAMACGLPVVVTRAGSLPEVVGDPALGEAATGANASGEAGAASVGSAGLLVPPGDVHALAGALLRVLADEQLARRLGAAGQERVARLFRWEAAARAMLAVYEELRCSGPS